MGYLLKGVWYRVGQYRIRLTYKQSAFLDALIELHGDSQLTATRMRSFLGGADVHDLFNKINTVLPGLVQRAANNVPFDTGGIKDWCYRINPDLRITRLGQTHELPKQGAPPHVFELNPGFESSLLHKDQTVVLWGEVAAVGYTLHRRCGRARSLSDIIRDLPLDHIAPIIVWTGTPSVEKVVWKEAQVLEALRILSLALPQSWLTQTTDGAEKLWRLNPGLTLTPRTEGA